MRRSLNRICLLGAGALAISLAGLAASSALVVGNHFEESKAKSCGAAAVECALAMTAVPAGKNLLVTKISCSVSYLDGPPVFSYFQFGHKTPTGALAEALDRGAAPFTYLVPTLLPSAAGTGLKVYAVNAEPQQIFTSGQIPYFYQALNDGKFNSFTCTVIGTLASNVS
jgi:hypothetical protein